MEAAAEQATNDQGADPSLMESIPEDMRDAISKLIQQTVQKQVEQRVAIEVDKMKNEVQQLKDQVTELEKQKAAAPQSKIGGAATSRPTSSMNTGKPQSRLGMNNTTSKLNNGKTSRDVSPRQGLGAKKLNGTTSGLQPPTRQLKPTGS